MFRVGMVGAGGMASKHAECYGAIANAELVGVMDTRLEAAQTLAEKHGAKAYVDFDAMLDDARPDIVDVCCPTPWHARICLPRGGSRRRTRRFRAFPPKSRWRRTLEDCQKMTAACELASVPLFVAQVVRFFPEFALAKQAMDEGAVGKPACRSGRKGAAGCRAPGTTGTPNST